MFRAFKWVILAAMLVLLVCRFRYSGVDFRNIGTPALFVAFGAIEMLNPATDARRVSPRLRRMCGYALAALGLLSVAFALVFGETETTKIGVNLLLIATSVLLVLTTHRTKNRVHSQPSTSGSTNVAK